MISLTKLWNVALVAALAIAAVACGGESSSDSSDSGSDGETLSLSVALAGQNTDHITYVAEAKGYFAEQNLEVEVFPELGANSTNLAVAGRVDVAGFGIDMPVVVSAQGREAQAIYGTQGGGGASAFVSDPQVVATLEDVSNLNPCRISTFPAGTAAYGYTKTFIAEINSDCEIVPMADVAAMIGSLESGRTQIANGSPVHFGSLVAENKATYLVNPFDDTELWRTILGEEPGPEAGLWGMKDRLEEKHDALVRYFVAMSKAREFAIDPANTEELLDIYLETDSFSTWDRDVLERDVVRSVQRFYSDVWGRGDGWISPEIWENRLEAFEWAELPDFDDPNSPTFSYENVVNMTFLEEAIAQRQNED